MRRPPAVVMHHSQPPLAVLFVVAAAISAVRLVTRHRRSTVSAGVDAVDSVEADVVHVLMNSVMAVDAAGLAMAWSRLPLWVLAGGLLIRLAVLIAPGSAKGFPAHEAAKAAAGYHLVATLVMIDAMAGHPILPALLLAGMLLCDATAVVTGGVLLGFTSREVTGAKDKHHGLKVPTVAPLEIVSAIVPHVVMDVGMAYMLIR